MNSPLRMAAKQSPSESLTRSVARGVKGEKRRFGARVEHELARVREAEQALADDEVLRGDPDLVHQEGLEVRGDVPVETEPDDRSLGSPLAEQALELAHEVFGFLLDLHVAVPQHAAHARVLHPEAGKEPAHEGPDDLFDGDEAVRPVPDPDEPRDPLGDRDEPEHRLLPLAGASHHEAEAEVGDERERMRGVARDGGQGRGRFSLMKCSSRPARSASSSSDLVEDEDALLAHLGHQRLPAGLLVVHQRPGPDRDRRELLGRGHPVLASGR